MALQREVDDETNGSPPKNEDAIKDDQMELNEYSQIASPRDKEYFGTKMQKSLEAALKTSKEGFCDIQKALKQLRYKASEQVDANHQCQKNLEGIYQKMTCVEKRDAMKTGLLWDFGRMVNVDIDTYRERVDPDNLRSFMILRMVQVRKEFKACMSWKNYFKSILYKIIGKSLAWEIVVQELFQALNFEKKKNNDSLTFLKSENGWGKNFDKNMKKLLAQPW